MSKARPLATAAILAAIGGILAAFWSPTAPSVASLSLGTDDAFAAYGLEPRENLVGGGALRWTQPKAAFRFEGVGPGQVEIDLVVKDHRTEVAVTANGARIGTLNVGKGHFTSTLPLQGSSLLLGIETEGFQASTRALGTQFVSLVVRPVPPRGETGRSPRFLWAATAFILLALAVQQIFQLSPLALLLPPGFLACLVLPAGLWRSAWLYQCTVLLGFAVVSSAFVAWLSRGSSGSRNALYVALLIAISIHGILPPSPLVIQGDAQLHGNKLAEIAGGNLFPVSRTDHKPPFDFPYGFSFYGLLSPWATKGSANVAVVRAGAAFFTALSALALGLAIGRTSAAFAAGSLILWTFAPVNLRMMPFGNLNNVFAQAVFVLFLTGPVLLRPGRARSVLLAFLVALSATSHLSSFIVFLVLLLMALLFHDRSSPAFKPLLSGTALAGAYFSAFVPLVLRQIPRLLGEHGGSRGVFDPWRLPNQIVLGLGWPLLGLVSLAFLSGRVRAALPLSRSVVASAVVLAVTGLVSPIEVRYLLAVIPVLAIVGAGVFLEPPLNDAGFPKQDLTSVVDFPWLRRLSSPAVLLPLSAFLMVASVVQGLRLLNEFVRLLSV